MESPYETLSPRHKGFTTSSDREEPLSDVIERIERINLDLSPSQLVKNPRPS